MKKKAVPKVVVEPIVEEEQKKDNYNMPKVVEPIVELEVDVGGEEKENKQETEEIEAEEKKVKEVQEGKNKELDMEELLEAADKNKGEYELEKGEDEGLLVEADINFNMPISHRDEE